MELYASAAGNSCKGAVPKVVTLVKADAAAFELDTNSCLLPLTHTAVRNPSEAHWVPTLNASGVTSLVCCQHTLRVENHLFISPQKTCTHLPMSYSLTPSLKLSSC